MGVNTFWKASITPILLNTHTEDTSGCQRKGKHETIPGAGAAAAHEVGSGIPDGTEGTDQGIEVQNPQELQRTFHISEETGEHTEHDHQCQPALRTDFDLFFFILYCFHSHDTTPPLTS